MIKTLISYIEIIPDGRPSASLFHPVGFFFLIPFNHLYFWLNTLGIIEGKKCAYKKQVARSKYNSNAQLGARIQEVLK